MNYVNQEILVLLALASAVIVLMGVNSFAKGVKVRWNMAQVVYYLRKIQGSKPIGNLEMLRITAKLDANPETPNSLKVALADSILQTATETATETASITDLISSLSLSHNSLEEMLITFNRLEASGEIMKEKFILGCIDNDFPPEGMMNSVVNIEGPKGLIYRVKGVHLMRLKYLITLGTKGVEIALHATSSSEEKSKVLALGTQVLKDIDTILGQ